ncbi:MAG TPA: glycosyltransferase family 4 protein [Candidatus Nitrosotalea sp.]|nr:glycosyltransferase family 4 protein [Candidatus Nitrosotalea sp.]
MDAGLESSAHLFLGTFPPRRCGVATFTQDLISAVDSATRGFSEVVAIDDSPAGEGYAYSGRVIARLRQNERASYREIAHLINRRHYRTLSVQHEFGLFGGADGEWLLDLFKLVRKPIALTLHTVLPAPSASHRRLVARLCRASECVVVLSEGARGLLLGEYDVEPRSVRMIPHGVPDVAFSETEKYKRATGLGGRFVVSTFGLLGPGKGLEMALDAIAQTASSLPEVLYLILGATHPVVARRDGEAYRQALRARIRSRDIERNVLMIDRYLTISDLLFYLAMTDAYLTPFVNADQVVSGTLAYAAGAGRAIVSTPYLYARELLADGRGIVVPFGDATAMAAALGRLARDDDYRLAMGRKAYAFGRSMTWPVVGHTYAALLNSITSTAVNR